MIIRPALAALNQSLGISNEWIAARGLSVCDEATTLEIADVGTDGREHLLTPAAAEAWQRLKSAAHNDNVSLLIVSAFRSIDRQAAIIRQKVDAGATIEEILTLSAPPGFSEHHTGRAIDVTTPGSRALEIEFEQTNACAWLTAHAASFGYYLSYPVGNSAGYQYEPWHWCFRNPSL